MVQVDAFDAGLLCQNGLNSKCGSTKIVIFVHCTSIIIIILDGNGDNAFSNNINFTLKLLFRLALTLLVFILHSEIIVNVRKIKSASILASASLSPMISNRFRSTKLWLNPKTPLQHCCYIFKTLIKFFSHCIFDEISISL